MAIACVRLLAALWRGLAATRNGSYGQRLERQGNRIQTCPWVAAPICWSSFPCCNSKGNPIVFLSLSGHQIFFGNTAYMLGFLSSFKRCSSCGKVTHGWPGQRLLARFSFHGLASKNLMRRSLRNKNGKMSYSRMTGDPEVRKKGKYAASYLLSGCYKRDKGKVSLGIPLIAAWR